MATKMTNIDTGPNFRRQGVIIMSVFALIWAAAAISGISNTAAVVVLLVIAFAVTIAIPMFAIRPVSSRTTPRHVPLDWQRRYNLIGLAEGGAIATAIFVLVATGWPELIPPVVCLIVGVHFVPLARIFDQSEYKWAGAALSLVAVVGAISLVGASAETVRAIVGVGAALILWTVSARVACSG